VKIAGDGVSHDSVRELVSTLRDPAFWDAEDTRRKLNAMVPEYRLSKFQKVLPERWQVEMVGGYLLDFEGAGRLLGGVGQR
jgi:ATP-dependent Lhr-like helicase